MLVLFDQGTPVPLRRELPHRIETAYERQWSTLANGDLLAMAEREGFDVLVTTDGNLRYQQSLATRKIVVVVLTTTSWPRIKQATRDIAAAIDRAKPGTYVEVEIP